VITGLSIAGDVFWILCLAVMSSLSWAAHRRIPAGTRVPVAWNGETVLVRAPKLAALWLIIGLGFAIGAWLKIESRHPDITTAGAIIWLGVRATVAPLLTVLHMTQVRKGLESLEREGAL
jgi:hypothetical protein